MKQFFIIAILATYLLAPIASQAYSPFDGGVITGMKDNTDTLIDNNYDPSTNGNTLNVIVAMIIQVFLGFLGTIFVVLMVYAGYTWMTASGDEKKVEKAQNTLQWAIVGLLIVLAAYILTYFVFSAVPGGAIRTTPIQ